MGSKRKRGREPSLSPFVTLRCATALRNVLGYATGLSEQEPTEDDYSVCESYLENLKLKLKMLRVRKQKNGESKAVSELDRLIAAQKKDMEETGHGE